MKKISISIVAFFIIAITSFLHAQQSEPSFITINGEKFFYHDVQKGESLYGISNQYGWNHEKLTSFNSDLAGKLKEGVRLYYPANNEQITSEEEWISTRPLEHILKPGENIYTISSLYGISVDSLYSLNPKLHHGTIAGDTLVINPGLTTFDGASKLIYNFKADDSLSSVAKNFHTSVASILRNNPGLNLSDIKSGKELIIVPNDIDIKTRVIEKVKVGSIKTYKVKKDESWYSIANREKISQEELMASNPGIIELKKNVEIVIPRLDTVKMVERFIDYDSRELTEAGVNEIANEIKSNKITSSNEISAKIAIVVKDASQNINMEFVRGFLVALDEFKYTPFKIDLKVIDESVTPQLINDSVIGKFNLIVTTIDKNIPESLIVAAKNTNVPLLNVFDVRSESYMNIPQFIQMLPPSDTFNEIASKKLSEKYSNSTIIFCGEVDPSDKIASGIRTALQDNCIFVNTIDELATRDFAEGMDYVIYLSQNGRNRDELKKSLSGIKDIRANHPFANITTLGRPGWVQQINALEKLMNEANTVIPSRFYFDKDNELSRRFLGEYNSLFHHAPIASSPMYSVAGYDVARFFIPAIEMQQITKEVFAPTNEYKMLQTDFSLKKYSDEGGYLNETCYLIKFYPYGVKDKELIQN